MTNLPTDLVDYLRAARQRFVEEPKEIWAVDDVFMEKFGLDRNEAHCMTYGGVRRLVVHKGVIDMLAKLETVQDPAHEGKLGRFHGLPIVSINTPPQPVASRSSSSQ